MARRLNQTSETLQNGDTIKQIVTEFFGPIGILLRNRCRNLC